MKTSKSKHLQTEWKQDCQVKNFFVHIFFLGLTTEEKVENSECDRPTNDSMYVSSTGKFSSLCGSSRKPYDQFPPT